MATSYHPPLKDINFMMEDVLQAAARTKDIPGALDADTGAAMIEAVAGFVKKVVFPLNAVGDREGCTYDPATGEVTTPKGFKEAYRKFTEMGLVGLLGDPQYGGQGMPHYLANAANEMLNSNFSLVAPAGLTGGACQAIAAVATEETKKFFLPLFYSGEWSCAMDLTEPGSGSDLANILTKAAPKEGDASALKNGDRCIVNGNKIFITAGKHDLLDPVTGNICHLVLAKLPGAPEGTKGISLFLVPERKIGDDGLPGEKNGVICTGIEHKMGIKASATCAISFENAEGILIGNPHEGMKAMFVMMNDERLNVAMQGLATAEMAYQNAFLFAEGRVQGKKMSEQFAGTAAHPVAILEHENISDSLVEMKAQIDGWRALATETAIQLDIYKHHPDEAKRKEAQVFVELMTPVLKACMSDFGLACAQKGIQIHGGMGFITETGVEQYYRDAIIATIYEGTNDIQSMDFAFRKAGNLAKIAPVIQGDMTKLLMGTPDLQAYVPDFMTAGKIFSETSELLKVKGKEAATGKPAAADDIVVNARDYMDMFGKLAVGAMWLKVMSAAAPKAQEEANGEGFYSNKMKLGRTYIQSIMLPEMKRLGSRIKFKANNVNKVSIKALRQDLG